MTFVSQETRRAAGKRQLSDFASEEDVWSSITPKLSCAGAVAWQMPVGGKVVGGLSHLP